MSAFRGAAKAWPDTGPLAVVEPTTNGQHAPLSTAVDTPPEAPWTVPDKAPGCVGDCDPVTPCRACERHPGPTRRSFPGWEAFYPDPPTDEELRRARPDWSALEDLRRELGVQAIGDISREPPAPLLAGRIDPTGHTILYGTGGVGKGIVATSWAASMTRIGANVLIVDYENHPEEWARRYHDLAGTDSSGQLYHVSPLAGDWRGDRGPMWGQTNDLTSIVDMLSIDLMVIDSIVPACGGADPMEPGTPVRYAAALEDINANRTPRTAVLSLAHVTKDKSLDYPYSSVFWHNLARMTWSLHEDDARRILTNRKANNYERVGRFVVDMAWHDGTLGEVTERQYTAVLAELIAEVLADGELSVEAIVERLSDERDDGEKVKANSVLVALRRGLKQVPPRFRLEDRKWRLT